MFRVSRQNHTSIKHQHIRTLADIVTPTTSFFASTNTTTPSFISSVPKKLWSHSLSFKCQYFYNHSHRYIQKKSRAVKDLCGAALTPAQKGPASELRVVTAMHQGWSFGDLHIHIHTFTNTYTHKYMHTHFHKYYTYTLSQIHTLSHIHTHTKTHASKHTHFQNPQAHPYMKTTSLAHKDIHTRWHTDTHTHACFQRQSWTLKWPSKILTKLKLIKAMMVTVQSKLLKHVVIAARTTLVHNWGILVILLLLELSYKLWICLKPIGPYTLP